MSSLHSKPNNSWLSASTRQISTKTHQLWANFALAHVLQKPLPRIADMKLAEIGSLLKDTVVEWIDDNAARVAASIAFYTLLSMAPLVLLSIALVGALMGEDTAQS